MRIKLLIDVIPSAVFLAHGLLDDLRCLVVRHRLSIVLGMSKMARFRLGEVGVTPFSGRKNEAAPVIGHCSM